MMTVCGRMGGVDWTNGREVRWEDASTRKNFDRALAVQGPDAKGRHRNRGEQRGRDKSREEGRDNDREMKREGRVGMEEGKCHACADALLQTESASEVTIETHMNHHSSLSCTPSGLHTIRLVQRLLVPASS